MSGLRRGDGASSTFGNGGGDSLAWFSDFRTSTGDNATALLDGKWTAVDHYTTPWGNRMAVVPSTGLGFPAGMTNVLAVRYESYESVLAQHGWDSDPDVDGNPGAPNMYVQNMCALPDIGASLYKRWYIHFDLIGNNPGGAGDQFHPVQTCVSSGAQCGTGWWKFNNNKELTPSATTNIDLHIQQTDTPHHFFYPNISRQATYRVEERWQRTGLNSAITHLRLYNSAGDLLSNDFACGIHGGESTADLVDTEHWDLTSIRHWLVGNQGTGGLIDGVPDVRSSDDPDHDRIYYGGFAVSLTDWVGAYPHASEAA